jgi:uncharacterized protein
MGATPTIVKAAFEEAVRSDAVVDTILDRARQLGFSNWYLGAGCLAQTVWNRAHSYDPADFIKDYDLVYYDDTDITYEGEDYYIQKARMLFADLPVEVEVRNQARVHLWYPQRLGLSIPQHRSVEAAISTWPTTATSVGARLDAGGFKVYAPFGLDDLMAGIVRPNKALASREVYEEKSTRWKRHWPQLTVVGWEAG